jgi:hypothetical protein
MTVPRTVACLAGVLIVAAPISSIAATIRTIAVSGQAAPGTTAVF